MYTHLLAQVKQQHPEWKASTIKNTLLMVALILSEKTVNLWKLKAGVSKQLGNKGVDSRSHYQRLKRWLWQEKATPGIWIQLARASLSLLSGQTDCLIIDGSSWKSGGLTYHFLTLSVLYQGVSVPIWWLELGRLGQSSQWHRQLLLRSALRLLNLRGKVLVGDREYIGVDWFAALKRAGIDVVIRLRVSDYQAAIEASGKSIAKLEAKAKSQLGQVCWQPFTLKEAQYTFVLVAYRNRSGKEEFLRLITTLTPAEAVEYYQQRYRIESMFRHLKSNGFDLEALHLEYGYKIRLMMAVVVLAYTLAVSYGLVDFKHKVKPKKHGSPEMSVFRWGLDKWQAYLRQLDCFMEKLLYFASNWLKNDCILTNPFVP
jgi:hypothetical protein